MLTMHLILNAQFIILGIDIINIFKTIEDTLFLISVTYNLFICNTVPITPYNLFICNYIPLI